MSLIQCKLIQYIYIGLGPHLVASYKTFSLLGENCEVFLVMQTMLFSADGIPVGGRQMSAPALLIGEAAQTLCLCLWSGARTLQRSASASWAGSSQRSDLHVQTVTQV